MRSRSEIMISITAQWDLILHLKSVDKTAVALFFSE